MNFGLIKDMDILLSVMEKRSTYLEDAMTTIPVIDCTASTRIHTNGVVPMSVDIFLLPGKYQIRVFEYPPKNSHLNHNERSELKIRVKSLV